MYELFTNAVKEVKAELRIMEEMYSLSSFEEVYVEDIGESQVLKDLGIDPIRAVSHTA